MKKGVLILLFNLLIFPVVKGQQLGKETWTEITHEVKQLVLTDERIRRELESLLFCTEQDTLLSAFKEYKYFHLYTKRKKDDCQELEIRLSNYPYKSKDLIGFFILKEYFVFVHNELLNFLEATECKKKFSYVEHKLGDLVFMEDDSPCWIVEYKKNQFKVLHYPANGKSIQKIE